MLIGILEWERRKWNSQMKGVGMCITLAPPKGIRRHMCEEMENTENPHAQALHSGMKPTLTPKAK